jgi:hypothetical protein
MYFFAQARDTTTAVRDASHNQASTQGWKLANVGVFNPLPSDGNDTMVADHIVMGQDTHWRNLFLFIDSARLQAEHDERRAIIQCDFAQLLKGDAQPWWAGRCSDNERYRMSTDVEIACIRRFDN